MKHLTIYAFILLSALALSKHIEEKTVLQMQIAELKQIHEQDWLTTIAMAEGYGQ